jgi:hypothetical protein
MATVSGREVGTWIPYDSAATVQAVTCICRVSDVGPASTLVHQVPCTLSTRLLRYYFVGHRSESFPPIFEQRGPERRRQPE